MNAEIRPKPLKALETAVDAGCAHGVFRFFKHRDLDAPLTQADRNQLVETVAEHVLSELHDWFHIPVQIGE